MRLENSIENPPPPSRLKRLLQTYTKAVVEMAIAGVLAREAQLCR